MSAMITPVKRAANANRMIKNFVTESTLDVPNMNGQL
jgi:hypothetical protein